MDHFVTCCKLVHSKTFEHQSENIFASIERECGYLKQGQVEIVG